MVFPEPERLLEKSRFPCLVGPQAAFLLGPAIGVVELLDSGELFYLAYGLKDSSFHERCPRLFPEFRRVDAHRADDMTLTTGRAFVEAGNEFFLFPVIETFPDNFPEVLYLRPCRQQFSAVLGIDWTPPLAFTTAGAGIQLNVLSPAQSFSDPVALCFEMCGQYISFLANSADAFNAMTRGAEMLCISLLCGR